MPERLTLTNERYAQILNHVSEEWVDHGLTNFATKQELCAALLRAKMEVTQQHSAESIRASNRLTEQVELLNKNLMARENFAV